MKNAMETNQEKSQKVQNTKPKHTEVVGPTWIPFKNMAESSREMVNLENGKIYQIHGNVWNKKIIYLVYKTLYETELFQHI